VRNDFTVGAVELQLAVGVALDLIALFVDGAMVPATEHGEIGERRRASLSPMANMVAFPDADATAREATAAISMVQRPSDGCRNRAGSGGNFDGPAVAVVWHQHTGRVTREALGRFRGNLLEATIARRERLFGDRLTMALQPAVMLQ
jgi:hypothetical protein